MTPADLALAAAYPGDSGARQPVHTVYVPADRVRPRTGRECGAAARAALTSTRPTPRPARVVGADPEAVGDVWPRLLAKLEREPVEDLRVDLEDGYGGTADDEEDARRRGGRAALAASPAGARRRSGHALQVPGGGRPGARGLRTLDLVLGALLGRRRCPTASW